MKLPLCYYYLLKYVLTPEYVLIPIVSITRKET